MASEKSLPGLDDSPRTTLFRAIELVLRSDPVLRQTVPPENWQTWDGTPDDSSGFAKTETPAIQLSPQAVEGKWFSPDMTVEPLVVVVELFVDGLNADDVGNLWWAVVRAIYPPNPLALDPSPRLVIEKQLRDAGSHTGVFEFTQPAFGQPDNPQAPAKSGRLYGMGQLKIDVRNVLNP